MNFSWRGVFGTIGERRGKGMREYQKYRKASRALSADKSL